jgi:hypothetical protein
VWPSKFEKERDKVKVGKRRNNGLSKVQPSFLTLLISCALFGKETRIGKKKFVEKGEKVLYCSELFLFK